MLDSIYGRRREERAILKELVPPTLPKFKKEIVLPRAQTNSNPFALPVVSAPPLDDAAQAAPASSTTPNSSSCSKTAEFARATKVSARLLAAPAAREQRNDSPRAAAKKKPPQVRTR